MVCGGYVMKFTWCGVKIDTLKHENTYRPKQNFIVGDAVVYPGVGIGVIQERRKVCGIEFFVIVLIKGSAQIIVPTHKMNKIGVELLE